MMIKSPLRLLVRSIVSLALAACVAGTPFALAGCNTTEGAGKDVKSLGKGIEDTAKDAKN